MKFKKKFSQNFLINSLYLKKILHFISPEIKIIYLEIGFGKAVLSKNILLKFLNYNLLIYFIEIENYFYIKFKNIYNINILNSNILKFNFFIFKKFFFYKFKIFIIGNIPYKITSLILLYLLSFIKNITNQYLLLQYEFLKKNLYYDNKLFIILKCFYKIKYIFVLNNLSFFPKPNIKSVFTNFKPLYLSLINFKDLFFFKKFLKIILIKKIKFIYLNKNKFKLNNFTRVNKFINFYFKFKNKFLKF